jgi:hypothetical protein
MASPRTLDGNASPNLGSCRLLQPQWIAYRLFDIGYAIDLNRAFGLLAENAPARSRPVRVTGQALQIPTPPMTVPLGRHVIAVGDRPHAVELEAQLFDFGTISVRIRLRGGDSLRWTEAVRLGADFNRCADVATTLPRMSLLSKSHAAAVSTVDANLLCRAVTRLPGIARNGIDTAT